MLVFFFFLISLFLNLDLDHKPILYEKKTKYKL